MGAVSSKKLARTNVFTTTGTTSHAATTRPSVTNGLAVANRRMGTADVTCDVWRVIRQAAENIPAPVPDHAAHTTARHARRSHVLHQPREVVQHGASAVGDRGKRVLGDDDRQAG